MQNNPHIAVIGLGYVGLPLAVAFSHKYPVTGFDINAGRVEELRQGIDKTREVELNELKGLMREKSFKGDSVNVDAGNVHRSAGDAGNVQYAAGADQANGLFCTADKNDIAHCTVYIVTVPTPVDKLNRPDLTPVIKATETVASVLNKGDVVIYESTVYPGVTEEVCVPILEKISGLRFNQDFTAGYSPERINPGDKEHTVTKIKKVTSGSTPYTAQFVDDLYASVITAGTHLAPSIKVAEAAKVIENAQRDINIAFVNELSKIFNRLDIDTHAVLEAAGTKWNFLHFKPGLVGGHCIGVDPYYLAQKAQETGYHPEIILAGRRLNDGMGEYVANQVIYHLIQRGNVIRDSHVLVLGITFKENCPDIRNSRVIDIITSLKKQGIAVDIHDPNADHAEVEHEYGIRPIGQEALTANLYDAIVLAVSHDEFLGTNWRQHLNGAGIVYDVKGALDLSMVDARL